MRLRYLVILAALTFLSLAGAAQEPVAAVCLAGQYQSGGKCYVCAAGTFSAQGSTACTPCPRGSTSAAGSAKCEPCPAGQRASVPEGPSDPPRCVACEAGTVSSVAGSLTCQPCAEGTHTNSESTACVADCRPGYQKPNIDANGMRTGECVACYAGMFSDGTICKVCPQGSTSLAGSSACFPCPPGQHASTLEGPSDLPRCVPCEAGTFSAVAGSLTCQPCPLGLQPAQGGTTCVSECQPGYQKTGIDASGAVQCVACVAGLVSDGRGPCLPCPRGSTSAAGSSECKLCAPGERASVPEGPSDVPRCVACEPGTYSSAAGALQCIQCAAGFTSVAGSSRCESIAPKCLVGEYAPQGSLQCAKCSAGTFNAVTGATSCTPCKAGSFSSLDGATQCTPCESGFFSSRDGAVQCDRCPPGYSSLPGALSCTATELNCLAGEYKTSAGTCAKCAPGTFSAKPGATSCTPCSAGSSSGDGATQCTLCSAGFYSLVGSWQCLKCSANTYSDTAGSPACRQCPQNSSSDASATMCICNPGYVASNGSCIPCPAGAECSGNSVVTTY